MKNLEDLVQIKEEILKKKGQIREIGIDLDNIEEIALNVIDSDLRGKIKRLQTTLKYEEEQLAKKQENYNYLKTDIKNQKKNKMQYGKGVVSVGGKMKKLNGLKQEIPNLKISIEANTKVLNKLISEFSKKLKINIKIITTQRKDALTEFKKELKLLEQLYDYKLKGRI